MLTLGIIADTHIPDRARALHPATLDTFRDAGVTEILHAGDICTPRILDQLAQVAPVTAVRGNRDWFARPALPLHRTLVYEAVAIGLTHGHLSWPDYMKDKLAYLARGPQPYRRFAERALSAFPSGVDVVVFGHNHAPYNVIHGDTLVFNPGSATVPNPLEPGLRPSVGLLRIDSGRVEGEVLFLG
ncbi:MAG: metallophosphoesterase family protein [Chloroflexi bacterium]|nr:metallophosphoesterase family protein [Chloroflexota bacterium]